MYGRFDFFFATTGGVTPITVSGACSSGGAGVTGGGAAVTGGGGAAVTGGGGAAVTGGGGAAVTGGGGAAVTGGGVTGAVLTGGVGVTGGGVGCVGVGGGGGTALSLVGASNPVVGEVFRPPAIVAAGESMIVAYSSVKSRLVSSCADEGGISSGVERTVACGSNGCELMSNPPSKVQNFCVSSGKVRLHFGQLFIVEENLSGD